MSHALSIPFVIVAFLALHDWATLPADGRLFRAAVLFAGTVSIYGELTVIILGLTLVLYGGSAVLGTGHPRRRIPLLSMLALTVALNPLYVGPLFQIAVQRSLMSTAGEVEAHLGDHYHHLSHVWVADIWALKSGWTGTVVFAFAALLTVLAVGGLVRLGGRFLKLFDPAVSNDQEYRRCLLLCLGIIALALVPLVVLLIDRNHPYQYQKLLVSISPLLVVGVAHAWDHRPRKAIAARLWWAPLLVVLASGLVSTTAMALQTTDPDHPSSSSLQSHVLDKDYQSALHLLGTLHGKKLVLACGPGLFQNSWMAYAARDNDVWLVNPWTNNNNVITPDGARTPVPLGHALAVGQHLIDLRTVPPDALLFTSDCCGPQVALEGARRLLWSNDHYQLWQLGPGLCTLRPTPFTLQPPQLPP
jgi:hypothetical protein